MSTEWSKALLAIAEHVQRNPPPPAEADIGTLFRRAELDGYALHAVSCERFWYSVPRKSDVFVGVASDVPVTVAVAIPAAGVRWVLRVRPGVVTPALDGRSFLPLIALRFHEVTVEVLDGGDDESVRLVYAVLSNAARRGFVAKKQAFEMADGKTLVIQHGMAGVVDAPPAGACVLPDVEERQVAEVRRKFWDESMPEFVARTWHPARHVRWCLPVDEVPHDPLRVHDVRVDVDALVAGLGNAVLGPPRMLPMGDCGAAAAVLGDLAASLGLRVSGDRLVAGSTRDGMYSHRDEPLCGGDLALIVYLTDCEGGRLVFEDGDEEIPAARPRRRGDVATWGIRRLHRAERVRAGDKRFAFVETHRA